MKKEKSKDTAVSHILVVEDEERTLDLYRRVLSDFEDVLYAPDGNRALEMIEESDNIGLALIDFNLPDISGLEIIGKVKDKFPRAEINVVTGVDEVEAAVESIKAGADKYITKPFDSDRIRKIAADNREKQALRREVRRLREELGTGKETVMITGRSRRMRRIMDTVESISGLDPTVLIQGETGTGKDLLARVIHEKGSRSHSSFVVTDCAVLSERLIESDLFGHEKGAFTDARQSRRGKFERAAGGTIFLNEIGTLSDPAQTKLLRVIENGEMERLGGSETLRVDVRVIAASNRDLEVEVERGNFRSDLFYRINTVTLELPSLRERTEDIPLLAEFFLEKYCRRYDKAIKEIDEEVFSVFFSYSWPGNIRQLENVIERAVITASGDRITIREIGQLLPESGTEKKGEGSGGLSLEKNEKRLIRTALKKSGYNLSRAARSLQVARSTLYSKMEKHGIRLPGKNNGKRGSVKKSETE